MLSFTGKVIIAMHSHNRRMLLSEALNLPLGGAVISRDTVEAAVWQTLGWDCDAAYVARLMLVIDAYTDSRCRRAVATWVRSGKRSDELPLTAILPAQSAVVRQQLQIMQNVPSVAAAAVTELTVRPLTRQKSDAEQHRSLALVKPSSLPADEPPCSDESPLRLVTVADAAGVLAVFPTESHEPAAELITCHGPCGRDLPRDAYWRSSRNASGLEYRCKDCRRTQNKRSKWRSRQKTQESLSSS